MRALLTEGKKGITIKVDTALYAEVKRYLEEHGMTMGEFVTLALTTEFHSKIQMKEEKNSFLFRPTVCSCKFAYLSQIMRLLFN